MYAIHHSPDGFIASEQPITALSPRLPVRNDSIRLFKGVRRLFVGQDKNVNMPGTPSLPLKQGNRHATI